MEKRVANRNTAYVFTLIPQTVDYFQTQNTAEVLRENQKTLMKSYQNHKAKNKSPPFSPIFSP